MKKYVSVISLWLLSLAVCAATTVVQFESGTFEPGTSGWSWLEAGFRFYLPDHGLARRGPQEQGWPHNGASSYVANFPSGWRPLTISNTSGSTFNVYSVDLAEYSNLFTQPKTISFLGIKSDSTSVSTTFTTDGQVAGSSGIYTDFQTFSFPAGFTDLVSLTVNTDLYSMDNVVLEVVPEPTSVALLALALCVAGVSRRKKLCKGA